MTGRDQTEFILKSTFAYKIEILRLLYTYRSDISGKGIYLCHLYICLIFFSTGLPTCGAMRQANVSLKETFSMGGRWD